MLRYQIPERYATEEYEIFSPTIGPLIFEGIPLTSWNPRTTMAYQGIPIEDWLAAKGLDRSDWQSPHGSCDLREVFPRYL